MRLLDVNQVCSGCRFCAGFAMTTRTNAALSDNLSNDIAFVALNSQATKAEIFRRAQQLYLAARNR
jgi:thioredoxin-related protein